MRIGALSVLNKTSSRDSFILASWHSAHSLTWRWSLGLNRERWLSVQPFAVRNSIGFGAGLGRLLAFNAMRSNDGWQWTVSAFWLSLNWSSQRPMWFRDIYRHERDRALEADFASQHIAAPPPVAETRTLH